jgi:hypothetical protein
MAPRDVEFQGREVEVEVGEVGAGGFQQYHCWAQDCFDRGVWSLQSVRAAHTNRLDDQTIWNNASTSTG